MFAVIVVYRPQRASLEALLDALRPQVDDIIVVDNGIAPELAQELLAGCRHLPMHGNAGLARAINEGAETAFSLGATHVALFDQDSLPSSGMIRELLHASRALQDAGQAVAAVGPRYVDRMRSDAPPFVRIRGGRLRAAEFTRDEPYVDVDFVITSGSLIDSTAWQAIGGMEERLFIDYVDIEWGLRAREMGYRSFGVCSATMNHAIGEAPVRVFGRLISIHSPTRRYYQFRNAVWLYRRRGMPNDWKVADGRRFLLKFLFYAIAKSPRGKTFRMMVKGVWHGLVGRMGALV
ncbi:glycosyltransferase family 2 protein [Aromatoleum buckelii]|uniref:Rhamnosyltransferase n=1 Tax=Aromatoleum buckelii TaxID=200254 RepID=A0ABX1N687_9RHOO|nr:glycosyltransferase family 2 protein [Aromatoleum buckelii]MCK0511898.1 glycosyltransferase family 2 protein [Aromatoleum buckelii]